MKYWPIFPVALILLAWALLCCGCEDFGDDHGDRDGGNGGNDGGNGGNGGFGGFGSLEQGVGGGGGGGAGGIACGIYTNNLTNDPFYEYYNTFVGTNIGGNGGKGGKSFVNSGTDGVAGAALNYHNE